MNNSKDSTRPDGKIKTHPEEVPKTPEEKKQQQSDPQLTELKGFVDPEEKLEVEGTDNPV